MYCCARLVYLVKWFKLEALPIIQRAWALMKYILGISAPHRPHSPAQSVQRLFLNTHCIDQYIICAFYFVCKIQQVPVTFHQIYEVYLELLRPYQVFKDLFPYSDIKKVWFEVDISITPVYEFNAVGDS